MHQQWKTKQWKCKQTAQERKRYIYTFSTVILFYCNKNLFIRIEVSAPFRSAHMCTYDGRNKATLNKIVLIATGSNIHSMLNVYLLLLFSSFRFVFFLFVVLSLTHGVNGENLNCLTEMTKPNHKPITE